MRQPSHRRPPPRRAPHRTPHRHPTGKPGVRASPQTLPSLREGKRVPVPAQDVRAPDRWASQTQPLRGGRGHRERKVRGTLKWYQKTATDRVLEEFSKGKGRDAMLEAGTGCGKTVMAISIVGQVRRKTAVLVHKDFLLNQWRERIEAFLPGVKVGVLQGPTCDHEGKGIVLCMIQSLVKRAYPAEFFDSIGLVVVDECHHIAAKTFSECLRPFGAAHRLGLTATPERSDGLERVVHWLLGPTVCKVERRKGRRAPPKSPAYGPSPTSPKGGKKSGGGTGPSCTPA